MNDEFPCLWFEDTGLCFGGLLITLFCIALGYFGPDISNLISNLIFH